MPVETVDLLVGINGAIAAVCWGAVFPLLSRLRYLPIRNVATLPAPSLSIIIPARNESRVIGRLLQSLSRQTHLADEVIVVDDHSEDDTARIAQNDAVTVLPSLERPKEWLGKNWACWQGAQRAKGEMLLFLDADVWLSTGALQALMACREIKLGLVSVQPYHVTKRFYENFSAFFNLVVLIGLDVFSSLSRSGRPAGAFGPVMLCRKTDYFKVGGHAAVRSHIVDDVALAQRFLNQGFQVHCFAGKGSIFFQMYPEGLGSLIEGWTKNLATAANMSRGTVVFFLAVWITGVVCATLGPVLAALSTGAPIAFLSALVYAAYAAQMRYELQRVGKFSAITAVLFPVFAFAFIVIFFLSVYRTYVQKKVTWKGRTIPLASKDIHP